MNLAHRDPHKLLAQLVPTSPPSRYSTRINPPGADSEDSSLLTEDPLAQDLEMYEEASEVGDTTAIVLHWKRTDNVRLVVAHLCRYTFFDSVLVWNNHPEIQLTHKVRVSRSAIEVRPFFMERPRSAHKHHSPPSGRLLPPRAAPPRNSASTTRRATSSSSLASSPARKPIPLTATSKTTTGSCAPCGRCIPSLGGTRKDRWWCRRVIKSRCCLDSSGVSTVRRASLFFRVTDQRERERERQADIFGNRVRAQTTPYIRASPGSGPAPSPLVNTSTVSSPSRPCLPTRGTNSPTPTTRSRRFRTNRRMSSRRASWNRCRLRLDIVMERGFGAIRSIL